MKKYGKCVQRWVSGACALLLACSGTSVLAQTGTTATDTTTQTSTLSNLTSYAEYSRNPYQLNGLTVDADLTTVEAVRGTKTLKSYEGYTGTVVFTEEDSEFSVKVTVPQQGAYRLWVEYFPTKGTNQSIEREILLDGEASFSEAVSIQFPRVFEDRPYEGTDQSVTRPQQVEIARWLERYCGDSVGYFENLYWNLEAGEHTLTFIGARGPMAIKRIAFVSTEDTAPTYQEYLNAHNADGAVAGNAQSETGYDKYQAEDMNEKSSPTLYAQNDRGSAGTEPHSASKDYLNYVGGSKWGTSGQWISWKVYAPEDGFYTIALRCRQNIERGVQVHRRVMIDDQLPFEEAGDITFRYSNKWQIIRLGNEDGAFKFYLPKGEHTIKLEVVLGSLGDLLSDANESLSALNEVNWKLMTVLGVDPDANRDYNIDTTMPEVIETLSAQADALDELVDKLEAACGQSNSYTSILQQFVTQMRKMVKRPETIAGTYQSFKDNIGALGDAILNMRAQPLSIDYLMVAEEDAKLPKAEPNFFVSLAYQFDLFIQSFVRDYTIVNDAVAESDQEPVVVWIGSGVTGGRDQAQILNRMIQQDFSQKSDVPVQLQLTGAGTVLVATLAGYGPDVALQLSGSTPVDYALRNTVYNLASFDDFEEVAKRFHESSLTGFRVEMNGVDGVYALPETASYYVMFYRSDILNRLNIDVNELKTWQNIIQVLGTLQENNMSIALPSAINTYAMFLFQMGGEFYKNGGRQSALDEEINIQAFKMWSNFYVNYQVPIEFSFENRFRLGEMPIGIMDYTTYNVLSVSAPEIQGLWGIAPLPGMEDENGNINNTSPAGGAGAVIMTGSQNKEGAWEFLKWWTEADVQANFGSELESIMGAAARYNTANIEAAATLPWTVNNRAILQSQWSVSQGIPQVPGGYYTERYIDFALRNVVNQNMSPRDTLLGYVDTINSEISLKRNEFGLD